MTSEQLFRRNNHSKWQIRWTAIPDRLHTKLSLLILEKYGFELVGKIKQVAEWERMSNNFRARVKRKGVSSEVVFRKHIQLKDKQSILLMSKILVFLKEQELLVPVIIRTKTDQLTFFHDGNFYQMFEFVSGNHYRGTRDELRDVALHIARLHLALARIPFVQDIAEKRVLLPPWTPDGWQNIFERAKARDARLDKIVAKSESLVLSEVQLVYDSRHSLAAARKQVVRNSLHPHDTIYEKGQLKALIDFEEVGINELMRDIANACHRFVRQFVVHERGQWQKKLPQGLEIFFKNYTAESKISEQEWRLVPVFIRDELLRKLYKDLNLYYRKADPRNIEGGELEKKLNLLKEAQAIASAIVETKS